jgi:hypothetical protein
MSSIGVAQTADSVEIKLYNVTDGAYVADGETIYVQTVGGGTIYQYRVEMSLENTFAMGGMSLGLTFSGDDALNVNWEPQTGGWGPGGQDDWAITVETGGRFDPAQGSGSFDMTGLLVTAQDADSLAPDSILLGGVSLFNNIAVGPMEQMFNFNFSLGIPGGGTGPVAFTIDSGKVGPVGDFVYTNTTGFNTAPMFSGPITVNVELEPGSAVGDNPALAYTYSLNQNYPNPFNPVTRINYSLARKGDVSIAVYNILGQQVKMLVDGEVEAGPNFVEWQGDDESGSTVASGIYFYKMVTDEYVETRKMVLMR